MSARRFVNLLVSDRRKLTYMLKRFDLSRNQLFYPTPEEAAEHAKVVPPLTTAADLTINSSAVAGAGAEGKKETKMKKPVYIRPPAATLTMKPSICAMTPYEEWDRMYCFPLTETQLFFGDGSTRIFRFDAETHCVDTMPSLHTPKCSPFALAVPPNPAISKEGEGGALYIMNSILRPDGKGQVPFEAIVYRRRYDMFHPNSSKAWHCDALPPPPFIHDLVGNKPASIWSYALVGGHTICISVRGVSTYCFDTVTREWSKAGDWLMPFYGRAEHVPELGLWFGVSYESNFHLPCAADISGVVRGEEPLPEHTRIWADTDVPEGWYPHFGPAKVVSLGSGRFCVTNFFETKDYDCRCGHLLVDDIFAVFTGMEVVLPSDGDGNDNDEGGFKGNDNGNDNDKGDCKGNANGNGNVSPGIRMIKHKSRFCRSHDSNKIVSVL